MNKNLRENLARQRRWREPEPIKSDTKQTRSKAVLFTAVIIAIVMIIAIFTATYKDSPAATISVTAEIHKIKTIPSPVSITMKVCTENLHVRFTPNGDIRGYLRKGEQVTLAMKDKNQLITEEKNNNTWILIAAPVAGWANTKFLCEQKGDKND